jgi:Ca-activated chloride channel family protein
MSRTLASFCIAALCATTAAWADPAEPASAGTLLMRAGADDTPLAVPALETHVEIQVTGPIVRGRVTQRFANPTSLWLEGLYVFPLPETAAVDALWMRIGERWIEGEIQERDRARRNYERARKTGRRASLIEQERPNLFTTSVANIAPGDAIEVVLEYQHSLRWDTDGVQLRFPMLVAPRYLPAAAAGGLERMSRPESAAPAAGRVHLTLELDAGVPLALLHCASHEPEIEQLGEGRYRVELVDVAADRDFLLEWRPAAGAEPLLASFVEEFDGRTYALVMLLPPQPEHAAPLTREAIFVIDTSGSMGGASMRQARAALRVAIERLDGNDYFNVIAFASRTRRLFPASVRADDGMRALALDFVRGLDADGGTEMLPALQGALLDEGHAVDLRQVVFITDGAIGNEVQLFRAIEDGLGRSRLFPVGIGSAPNAFFMRRAARHGRGSFTYVSRADEVEQRVDALLTKLERPVLRDIDVRWDDPGESWPARVEDLYAGEPIVIAAELPRPGTSLLVRGRDAEGPWVAGAPLEAARRGRGIHRLWARRKIEGLMESLVGGAAAEQVRRDVIDVALRHQLVSRYTSLVAVERTPSRPRSAPGASGRVPLARLHGWLAPGARPQGATPAPLLLLAGTLLLIASLTRLRAARR